MRKYYWQGYLAGWLKRRRHWRRLAFWRGYFSSWLRQYFVICVASLALAVGLSVDAPQDDQEDSAEQGCFQIIVGEALPDGFLFVEVPDCEVE